LVVRLLELTWLDAALLLGLVGRRAHAVRNLPGPPTVALSANYVDSTNVEKFIAELKWQAIAEQEAEISAGDGASAGGAEGRSASLLQAMEAVGFGSDGEEESPGDKPWCEFKRV
jgi:hypothetical protein